MKEMSLLALPLVFLFFFSVAPPKKLRSWNWIFFLHRSAIKTMQAQLPVLVMLLHVQNSPVLYHMMLVTTGIAATQKALQTIIKLSELNDVVLLCSQEAMPPSCR